MTSSKHKAEAEVDRYLIDKAPNPYADRKDVSSEPVWFDRIMELLQRKRT